MLDAEAWDLRILILAPTGRDGSLICDVLRKQGFACEPCSDVDRLTARLEGETGLCILAEEALVGVSVSKLLQILHAQPTWSDLPLIFLTTSGTIPTDASTRILSLLGDQVNITILERPVRVPTLVSAVRSALRARRRQYEVRQHLIDREKNETKMLQLQKLESLGVLAGGVAHDFNNLLTGILGNASLALDASAQGLPIDGLLQDVIEASERAADLTRQLLAYSGRGRFVLQPADLSDLVRKITKLLFTSIPKTVRVEFDLDEHLPLTEGDTSQLQQIVMNLVINGAESIRPGQSGFVRVRTGVEMMDRAALQHAFASDAAVPGEYVYLEVEDSGSGMNDATISRIFDPFFTTKFMGRGLGLAAVLGIVRSHKGALRLRSVPGHGTTFRVFFPVSALERRPAARTMQKGSAGSGVILVIDDEEMVQNTIRNTLERAGYTVILAGDGQQGVALYRSMMDRVALVLLDLAMPVMGGEEAFHKLKSVRPDVKVVVSSGYDETDVVQRFNGNGVDGFLQKPFTSADLTAKVKEVLTRT